MFVVEVGVLTFMPEIGVESQIKDLPAFLN